MVSRTWELGSSLVLPSYLPRPLCVSSRSVPTTSCHVLAVEGRPQAATQPEGTPKRRGAIAALEAEKQKALPLLPAQEESRNPRQELGVDGEGKNVGATPLSVIRSRARTGVGGGRNSAPGLAPSLDRKWGRRGSSFSGKNLGDPTGRRSGEECLCNTVGRAEWVGWRRVSVRGRSEGTDISVTLCGRSKGTVLV